MRKVVAAALVIALALMVGCANVKLKDPSEMTPQEKATFVMKLYSKAVANVLEMEKMPLTPEQQKAVASQKDFLRKAAIPIDAYVGCIDGGMKPSAELEQQINGLIDKLILGL
jgi:uncharacterized protein YceK